MTVKAKESLIDALLNIQPGKSILIEYGDIPKDAERITLPSGMGGTVIERRGNLLAIGMLAGAAVTTVLYVQKDSQMIRIRPIPHQKMQTKTGDIVNAPEYDRWVGRIKKEAPEYLPVWETKPITTFPSPQPAPTPLPPSPPGIHGTEYELLYNLIASDGMDELYEARRELRDIILHDTARKQLTDSDIAYLQEVIDAKEREYQEKYPVGEEKEIFRKVEPLKRPEKQIRGAREIIAEREEEKEDDVHGYKITRPTIDIKRLNFGEAHDFLLAYNKYLPEILRIGLRAWFIQHPQAQRFPLHQTNYDQLFQVLSMYISPYPPKNIKELIAYRILKDTIGVAVEFGMTLALSQIDWETYYQQAKTQSKQTPDLTTFQKDIMMTLNGILQEVRVT